MEEDSKRPSHISYKEYQKKVTKNPNEGIIIFVSAFFILLLLFLGIAKQISPDIDVSIGEDENATTSTEEVAKSAVDERLKNLQEEDETSAQQDKTFSPELDEKVVLPDKEKSASDNTQPVQQPVKVDEEATPKPSETAAPAPKPVPVQQHVSTAKVIVGHYATKEQAEVAKGIIAESGLSSSPYVRSIGGAYTIQVGSYATKDKAQELANEFLRNNYPARVIVE